MKSKHAIKHHDLFFKSSLQDIEIAKDFFKAHLPKKIQKMIDWETLHLENDSFIEEDFQTAFTDVLYQVKLKKQYGKEQIFLYILSEHQSTPDPLMAFRLWYYRCKIWDRFLKQIDKKEQSDTLKLPLILNLVFYNGKQKPYPYTLNFFDLFEDAALAQELYNAPAPLIDLSVIPDDELLTHGHVAAMELCHKHAYSRDLIPIIKALIQHDLLQLIKTLDGGKHISRLVKYALEYEKDNYGSEIVTLLADALPDMKETIMSAADQLRQEGHNRGMQQGMQQEKISIASNLLKEGLGEDLVTKATGLDTTTLANLKKEIAKQ